LFLKTCGENLIEEGFTRIRGIGLIEGKTIGPKVLF